MPGEQLELVLHVHVGQTPALQPAEAAQPAADLVGRQLAVEPGPVTTTSTSQSSVAQAASASEWRAGCAPLRGFHLSEPQRRAVAERGRHVRAAWREPGRPAA